MENYNIEFSSRQAELRPGRAGSLGSRGVAGKGGTEEQHQQSQENGAGEREVGRGVGSMIRHDGHLLRGFRKDFPVSAHDSRGLSLQSMTQRERQRFQKVATGYNHQTVTG